MSELDPEDRVYAFKIEKTDGLLIDSVEKYNHLMNELIRLTLKKTEERPDLEGQQVWIVWTTEDMEDRVEED